MAIHKILLIYILFPSFSIFFTGTFIDNGERSNIHDCVTACCNTPSCDVALLNGKKCFSVQCNGNNCQEVRTESSLSTPTLAYVARYAHTEHTQGRTFKDLKLQSRKYN